MTDVEALRVVMLRGLYVSAGRAVRAVGNKEPEPPMLWVASTQPVGDPHRSAGATLAEAVTAMINREQMDKAVEDVIDDDSDADLM